MSKLDFMHSSSYHTQRCHMSKGKDSDFKYPCALNIGVGGEPTCVCYSSRNDKGHFGIPKVIFSWFGSGVFIDYEGEWGCCEVVAAIASPVEDLPKIKQALQSPEFLELMGALHVGGMVGNVFPIKSMRYLKKDFWKEFCDG